MKNVLRLFEIFGGAVFVIVILAGVCVVEVTPMPGIKMEFLGVRLAAGDLIFDSHKSNFAYIWHGLEIAGVEMFGMVLQSNGTIEVVW